MDAVALAQHPDIARNAERLAAAGVDDANHLVVISYNLHAHIDKFGPDSLAAAAAFHQTTDEPTAAQLLAWRDATPMQMDAVNTAESVAASHDYSTFDEPYNLLTTAGLARITSLIVAGGGQAWNNTNSRIGVGNSATSATVADTDLGAAAGSANRQFQVSNATYPQTANGVITFQSTFSTSVANFTWNEWCIDEGTTNGTTVVATMMNHKISSLGTKTSASSWIFTVTVTLA
jgi:hypothetical protein